MRSLPEADQAEARTPHQLGWRLVLGELRAEVLTGSLPLAADVAGRAASVPGAEGHLRLDVRADRIDLIGGGQTRTLRSVRQTRRPTATVIAVGLRMSTVSSG